MTTEKPVFIWWLRQEDCTKILEQCDIDRMGWPAYLVSQFNSRLGRAGRGRLWVAPEFAMNGIVWNEKHPVAQHIEATEAGGIVVWPSEAARLVDMPGLLTDTNLTVVGVEVFHLLDRQMNPETGEIAQGGQGLDFDALLGEWKQLDTHIKAAGDVLSAERREWEEERKGRVAQKKVWEHRIETIKALLRDEMLEVRKKGGPTTFGGVQLYGAPSVCSNDMAKAQWALLGVEHQKAPLVQLTWVDEKRIIDWIERNPAEAREVGLWLERTDDSWHIRRASGKGKETA